MAIEINDKGILLAVFRLTPGGGSPQDWLLYGRGVRGVTVDEDGIPTVELEESIAQISALSLERTSFWFEATCNGDGYASPIATSLDAGVNLNAVVVPTFSGADPVTGEPTLTPVPVDVMVYRYPLQLPFIATGVAPAP